MQRTLKRELKVLEVVERETKASLTVSVYREIQLINTVPRDGIMGAFFFV